MTSGLVDAAEYCQAGMPTTGHREMPAAGENNA